MRRFWFAGKLYTSDDCAWLEWFVPCELLLTDVDLCSFVCLGLLVCNGLDAVETESWLKGVKPGQNPTKDAIKSSEIFPSDCLHYRSDRGTLGGGIFILVHKSIISIEQPEIITDCEIEWVKIKLQKYKDLFIGCFYMPHRNLKDTQELDKSIMSHIANVTAHTFAGPGYWMVTQTTRIDTSLLLSGTRVCLYISLW
jgi:hypothetical protein